MYVEFYALMEHREIMCKKDLLYVYTEGLLVFIWSYIAFLLVTYSATAMTDWFEGKILFLIVHLLADTFINRHTRPGSGHAITRILLIFDCLRTFKLCNDLNELNLVLKFGATLWYCGLLNTNNLIPVEKPH